MMHTLSKRMIGIRFRLGNCRREQYFGTRSLLNSLRNTAWEVENIEPTCMRIICLYIFSAVWRKVRPNGNTQWDDIPQFIANAKLHFRPQQPWKAPQSPSFQWLSGIVFLWFPLQGTRRSRRVFQPSSWNWRVHNRVQCKYPAWKKGDWGLDLFGNPAKFQASRKGRVWSSKFSFPPFRR